MSEYDKPIKAPEKRYLGDGAYVEFDGYQVLLTTSNGIETTNTVALEPEVWLAFKRWGKELDEFIREYRRRENREPGIAEVTPIDDIPY